MHPACRLLPGQAYLTHQPDPYSVRQLGHGNAPGAPGTFVKVSQAARFASTRLALSKPPTQVV